MSYNGLFTANKIAGEPTKIAKQKLPNPNGMAAYAAEDWLVLKITNTTDKAGVAALFDASGKFENQDGLVTKDGITIESTNTDYMNFINDLASTEQYAVSLTRCQTLAGQELQFDNSWDLLETVRLTKGSRLVSQIIPSVYLDPYQQQDNRVDVVEGYVITRQRVLNIVINPNTTLIMRMKISKSLQNG